MVVSNTVENNFFLTKDGTIIKLEDVGCTSVIQFRKCEVKGLKNYPCNSKELNIAKIVGYYKIQEDYLSIFFYKKMVVLPIRSNGATTISLISAPYSSVI